QWDFLRAAFPPGNVHVAVTPSSTDEPSDEPSRDALLTTPEKRARKLLNEGEADWTADRLHRACVSELSQSLVDRLIDCHSIVLLVEGEDAVENEDARKAIDTAIKQVVATRSLWPKPIDNPPEVVTIRFADRETERTLLWSLEIDGEAKSPQVAVVFGRGRRLGPVLLANEFDTEKLARRLGIISIDCECDFNVAAMIGPMIPHTWTEEHESRATRSLGFDPGMPLVQVEVEQILARWPTDEPSRVGDTTFGDPLAGYQEIELPSADTDSSEMTAATDAGSEEPVVDGAPDELLTDHSSSSGAEPGEAEILAAPSWKLVGWTLGGVLLVSLLGSGVVWLRRGP
ncbi:MAG: hypothetical protein ACR2NU_14540, partial [Aeoliella sp.]